MTYVLDSWALLAWMQNAPAASDEVQRLLDDASAGTSDLLLSQINAGEIFYVVAKTHSMTRAREIRTSLTRLPVAFISVSDDHVWDAAALKADYPLSYADAFAASLALNQTATLVTGDREFLPVEANEELSVLWLHHSG